MTAKLSTSFFTFSAPEVSPSTFTLAVPSLPSTSSTFFSTLSAPSVLPSTFALAVPSLPSTSSTFFSTFSAPSVSPSTFTLGLLSFPSVSFNFFNILSIVSSISSLPSISTPGLHMKSPIIFNCSSNVLAFLRASSIPSNCNIAVAVFHQKHLLYFLAFQHFQHHMFEHIP